MTKQNVIHKHIVMSEKYRKWLLKESQRRRKGGKVIRTSKTRKWWKQFDKDFKKKWRKEQKGEQK